MKNSIGIIGGMGPHAGLDLFEKILNNTDANTDKDHLPIILFSFPKKIPDRNDFLFGRSKKNPAYNIADIIEKAHFIGSNIIGIACNAAHSPKIFHKIKSLLLDKDIKVQLINMVDETARHIKINFNQINKLGVLSIEGTFYAKTYENKLLEYGLDYIIPSKEIIHKMHECVWNSNYGIKSCPSPISQKVKSELIDIINYFKEYGAQAIILGCTEFPMAINKRIISNIPIFDPNQILARALISAYKNNKDNNN